jgi:hypothetical protein
MKRLALKRLAFTAVSVISLIVIVIVIVIAIVSTQSHPAHASTGGSVGSGGGTPGTASNVTLVGHDPLFNRGMNAALALYSHYVYVGNRTDGSDRCTGGGTGCPHPHPGVLIVDVSNPAAPQDVGEIGQPYEGSVGITSRELRVWPQQQLLMVMNFRCSSVIHVCPQGTTPSSPSTSRSSTSPTPCIPPSCSATCPPRAPGSRSSPTRCSSG